MDTSAEPDFDAGNLIRTFAKIIDLQIDVDPEVLAKQVSGESVSIAATHQTFRHSAATLQRCKIINAYIEKLYGDIGMLTAVKEHLSMIKDQLEMEKVDTFIAERISKDAVSAFHSIGRDNLESFLEKLEQARGLGIGIRYQYQENQDHGIGGYFGNSVSPSGKQLLVKQEILDEMTQSQSMFENSLSKRNVKDQSFLQNIRRGLNEPDLPIKMEEEDEV